MTDSIARPIIYGEVLFDEYADGNRHIGGAAFNVAWHLQGFQQRPLFISRIGQDEDGELVFMAMRQWGMDGLGVQIDPAHPTGKVRVISNDDEILFKIEDEQAYDYISGVLSAGVVRDRSTSLVYCGTLALRHETSRKTYHAICVENDLPRFVDLNLRAPWWDVVTVKKLIQGANWVKLNEHELKSLLKRDILSETDLRMAADIFRRSYAIENLFVTRGDKGACYCAHEIWLSRKATVIDGYIDPLGAGDAFSAVCILGIEKGWSHSQILERASQFAERICKQQGASDKNQLLYKELLESWS
jgi:fructokinase